MDRRTFLARSAIGTLALRLPPFGKVVPVGTQFDPPDEAGLRRIATAALEAATASGAAYADVRLTLTDWQGVSTQNRDAGAGQTRSYAIGIRTFVDNCWGFVSGPSWTFNEVRRIARASVAQARASNWQDANPIPRISQQPMQGKWVTPIERDPFEVSVEEKAEFLLAAADAAFSLTGVAGVYSTTEWVRQQKVFASTDGVYLRQTLYRSLGRYSQFLIGLVDPSGLGSTQVVSERISATSGGYEVLEKSGLEDEIPKLVEQGYASLKNPTPVEIGRYDCVFSASLMGVLTRDTIGNALELDRAQGYEADESGTSYLSPPEKYLGIARLAPDFVTISANRSQPRGAATVKWDDEGREPRTTFLVHKGVVADYLAMEQLPSRRVGQQVVQPQGVASSSDAFLPAMQCLPNLVLEPGTHDQSFNDLVSRVQRGYAFMDVDVLSDQQIMKINGRGTAFEIRSGKIGRPVQNAGFLLKSSDLWKNITSLGGPSTAKTIGVGSSKGHPFQHSELSVTAVPACIRDVDVVDLERWKYNAKK